MSKRVDAERRQMAAERRLREALRTHAENGIILALLQEGLPMAVIGARLGLAATALKVRLRKLRAVDDRGRKPQGGGPS